MKAKQKKVQVVVAAPHPSEGWSFLFFKTNKTRGRFWQNVTGHVERDEPLASAAIREVREESGLADTAIRSLEELHLIHHFVDQRGRETEEHSFLLVANAQWKPTIDPHEHEDWRWVKESEFSADMLKWPSNAETLLKARSLISGRASC